MQTWRAAHPSPHCFYYALRFRGEPYTEITMALCGDLDEQGVFFIVL